MRIEELRIGQVVYNTDNEKLTVEGISTGMNGEQVYTRNSARFSKWYKPAELSDTPTETEWVDLGLPSGTLWKSDIERDNHGEPVYMSYNEAKATFKNDLPKSWQFAELYEECEWKYDFEKSGYKIIGPNGNSIFLPAEGHKEEPFDVKNGYYWSAMPFSSHTSHYLFFNLIGVYTQHVIRNSSGLTIILCKNK